MIVDGAVLDRMLTGTISDPRTYLRALGYNPPHLAAVADGALPLMAQVNHSVWIALDGCGEREGVCGGGVVWLGQPVVWCPLCRNRATGGTWRHVALPAEREEIEAVLLARPEEYRNWVPGESVADLLADNAAHLEVG